MTPCILAKKESLFVFIGLLLVKSLKWGNIVCVKFQVVVVAVGVEIEMVVVVEADGVVTKEEVREFY